MKYISFARLAFCGAMLVLTVGSQGLAAAAPDTNAASPFPAFDLPPPQPASSSNMLTHFLSATNAADAWLELSNASTEPPAPAEWADKDPTDDEKFRYLLPFALALADKSKDYYTRFPNDTNALAARGREYGILSWAVTRGATNQQDRLDAVEKVMLADTNLTEDDRFEMRESALQRQMHAKEDESDQALLETFEKGARDLQKEFPKRPEVLAMLLQVASNSDPEKARAILDEVSTNPLPAELKDAVDDLRRDLDRIGKTLDIQFKAVDGRDVDLSKMKGKVVLVDFWSRTSEESLAMQVMDIKEAYDNFHTNGFEVIGINMDDDQASLTNFLSDEKIEWPQYFDGKQADTKFAAQYNVKSLPAVWLVDKKGTVRYVNFGFDLKKKVQSLLAE